MVGIASAWLEAVENQDVRLYIETAGLNVRQRGAFYGQVNDYALQTGRSNRYAKKVPLAMALGEKTGSRTARNSDGARATGHLEKRQ